MSIARIQRIEAAEPALNGMELPEFHRFSVKEYHQLGEMGVLTPEHRVELIDGLIVHKPMQKTPHARAVRRLVTRLTRLLGERWAIQSQLPITLRRSEPEPDVCIMAGPEERYDERHPGARDIALVIEVADLSLVLDRGAKLRMYALNRLPSYWIVNIPNSRVEVYTEPRAGRIPTYLHSIEFARDSKVPVVLRGKSIGEVAVNDFLR